MRDLAFLDGSHEVSRLGAHRVYLGLDGDGSLLEVVVGPKPAVTPTWPLPHATLAFVHEASARGDDAIVVSEGVRGPTPRLPGLLMAENFEAYEARKLLLHNMSHAALAYLGAPRGQTLIWQCTADSEVAPIVAQAMNDVCRALVLEYGFGPSTLGIYAEDLLSRFANRALGDTVSRVAADPLRKLRPEDRLIGAASLCLKHGITPMALAQVIHAALSYDNAGDPAAGRLQEMRKIQGDAGVLKSLGALPLIRC